MNIQSHCRSKVSEWSGNACASRVLAAPREHLVARDKYFVEGTLSVGGNAFAFIYHHASSAETIIHAFTVFQRGSFVVIAFHVR